MRNFFLKLILTFSFCVILFTSCAFLSKGENLKTTEQSDIKKPNIIFYLADDQDIYDYGCYGNDKVKTPAVDKLAKEGILFESAFTGQAICAPTRSQLYTGKYPLKNGCFMNHIKSKSNQKSVAHHMQELGYEVVLAGKSHVGPKSVYNWDKSWYGTLEKGKPRRIIPKDKINEYFKNADKPFCMFIASEYPHAPHMKVENAKEEDVKFFPFHGDIQKQDIKAKANYYRSIEEDNNQLEDVLSAVDKYLGKNTMFIYSADHGISGKYRLYDRGLGVPFVVRWPGVIKPNTRSDIMIHYTDVLPTFMDIAGGKAPEDVDGKSFLKILKGDHNEIHDYVYGVQTMQNVQKTAVFPARSVRSKKYKYIKNFNSIEVYKNNYTDNERINRFIKVGAERFNDIPYEELYDIEKDPFEQNNLAKKSSYEDVKETMATVMLKWMVDQNDFLVKENYMPLLKPERHWLDKSSKFQKVPKELENTLLESDYLITHY
jgi:uncharacterized sulfatase